MHDKTLARERKTGSIGVCYNMSPIKTKTSLMQVGFLLNHYAGHQAFHSIPVACALSARYPSIKVSIIAADSSQLELARRIGRGWPNHACRFVKAEVPGYARLADRLLANFVFIRKRAVLGANRGLLADLDVLVVPETTSIALKMYPEFSDLKFVRIRHGEGDREVGFGNDLARFDLVLVSGRKARDRFLQNGAVAEENIAIIGYPKFETLKAKVTSPPAPLFQNDRPTVLYNPHFSRNESSWTRMGRLVLDYFCNNQDFNLVFAPHVILYLRKWRHGAFSLDSYRGVPTIHIDTGSTASLDMTYTLLADIYLGDVSSQVYEFLLEPRPCVFLNPRRKRWKGNPKFAHWKAGDVVESFEEFHGALNSAAANHEKYRKEQERLFEYTFADCGGTPASELGADAIVQRFACR